MKKDTYTTNDLNKLMNELNETIILQAKGFNHSVHGLLKEITLLKKDNNFLMSLVLTKLKIDEEEFKSYAEYFDKNYPSKIVDDYLEMFKMKIYTDKKEFKKILKDKQNKESQQEETIN